MEGGVGRGKDDGGHVGHDGNDRHDLHDRIPRANVLATSWLRAAASIQQLAPHPPTHVGEHTATVPPVAPAAPTAFTP